MSLIRPCDVININDSLIEWVLFNFIHKYSFIVKYLLKRYSKSMAY